MEPIPPNSRYSIVSVSLKYCKNSRNSMNPKLYQFAAIRGSSGRSVIPPFHQILEEL